MSEADPAAEGIPPPPPAAPADVSPPPPPPAPADPFASFLKGAVIVLFLAVCAAGVHRIQQRVRRLEDFRVDLSRARVEAPPWLPPREAEEIRRRAAGGGKVPIRQEGLPEWVAGRLESDPRVLRVLGARRVHPDAVEILLELRRPVALVEYGKAFAAVDGRGIRVPGDYATRPLPRIRGWSGSMPDPGEPFCREVADGAAVAAAIPDDLAGSLGLSTVDVAGVPRGGGVVLRRGAGKGEVPLAVEWGRAPSSEDVALDPPVEAKVGRLRLAATRFPGLRGLRAVRLGFDDLVVVPL